MEKGEIEESEKEMKDLDEKESLDEKKDWDEKNFLDEKFLEEKAMKELNEKKEWRERDIQALRELVQTHPGLSARVDDAFLLAFLRARKFDYERAFALILNYYTLRTRNPELYRDYHPSAVTNALNNDVINVITRRDQQGRRLLFLRPGRWNVSSTTSDDHFRLLSMSLDLIMMEETTQICGVALIVDFEGVKWRHFRSVGVTNLKKFVNLVQDCVPIRVKAVHFIREPAAFTALLSILKPFLKEKLLRRLHFHGDDATSLHVDISRSHLPLDLGGVDGPLEPSVWRSRLLDADEEFQASSRRFRIDEKACGELLHGNNADDCTYVFGVYQASLQDVE